jgi:proteasome component ECM29
MGKAPTGENLSTYKELCSLATDLNQRTWCSSSCIWLTTTPCGTPEKARRLDSRALPLEPVLRWSTLAQDCSKVIPLPIRSNPKDPGLNVFYLVSDSSREHEDCGQIFDSDCGRNFKQLTSNQWRVRESCCLALQDLLRGRTLESALDSVPELWHKLFRVMDDIKESVRIAASKTAGTLSRCCIRCAIRPPGQRPARRLSKQFCLRCWKTA